MSKFVLQPEDGSVDFGNTRGDESVDLQVVRNNATEVASGYASFLIGGKANTASGTYSAAFGANNTASGTGSLAIGVNNGATGNYSLVGGVNSQSVGLASSSLGYESIAYGPYSAIAFASDSLTDIGATFSHIGGGQSGNAYMYAQDVYSGGKFATQGDAQTSTILVRRSVTNVSAGNPTIELLLDGTTTTFLVAPKGNNRAWSCMLDSIAVCTNQGASPQLTTGDVYTIKQSCFIKKVGGTLSISPIDTIAEESNTNMATSTFTITAGGSGNVVIGFNVPATSATSNFRIVSKMTMTEVAW
jgi:hypothetical protein